MDALKILMVDDEARMRKLVKDFLTNKGFSVVEAGDGEEALEIFFAQKDIALILLDVMMPKMDGWEVLKTIRKYSKVPVIMLTARSEERDELQGFSLGVDEYISKPFSPKILVARVEALLRRTNAVSADIMNIGGICIDKAAHRVTIDGKEIFVPNSQLSGTKIVNYTVLGRRRVDLNFTASYDAPTATVKQAIGEVLEDIPQIITDPPPEIHLSDYQASSIQYVVRAWTTAADYWTVYYAIQEGVREAFDRHGVEMTYDHLNVHILDRK